MHFHHGLDVMEQLRRDELGSCVTAAVQICKGMGQERQRSQLLCPCRRVRSLSKTDHSAAHMPHFPSSAFALQLCSRLGLTSVGAMLHTSDRANALAHVHIHWICWVEQLVHICAARHRKEPLMDRPAGKQKKTEKVE
jgi:hypothetical protein